MDTSPDLIITRHDEVRAIFADPRFGVPAAQQGGGEATLAWLRGMVSRFSDGPDHERRRAVVRVLLRPFDLDRLRAAAHARASSAIEKAAGRPFDAMAEVARRVPVAVLASAMGLGDGTASDGGTSGRGASDCRVSGSGVSGSGVSGSGVSGNADPDGGAPDGWVRDSGVRDGAAPDRAAPDSPRAPGTANGTGGPPRLAGADDVDAVVASVAAVAAAYHSGGGPPADEAVRRLVPLLGPGEPEVVANRIGLLTQAYDATAGLIGNAVIQAHAHSPAHVAARPGPGAAWPVDALLAETLRYDPPVRLTRRVARSAADVGGRRVPAGTTVVLDLAAANRDPEVFADPDRFDPGRAYIPHLTFGYGSRPCPGSAHALGIAAGAVETLLARCRVADMPVGYVPSPNARVPARLMMVPR